MPGSSSVCCMFFFEVAGWAGRYRLSNCQKVTGLIPLIVGVEPASLRDVAPPPPLCCNGCMSHKVDPLRFTIIQLKAAKGLPFTTVTIQSATQ